MKVLEETPVQKEAGQRGLRLPSLHPPLMDQMQNRDSQYTEEKIKSKHQNNKMGPTDDRQVR